MIPLVNLALQTAEIESEVLSGWKRLLTSSQFILGPEVDDFEQSFAHYSGVRHCIGVGNGTDAIELALRAAGLEPGDSVVIPANTFVATALAVVRAGLKVEIVDCNPSTYLIDQDQAAENLSKGARAVIPVHLFGQIAPIEDILRECPDALVIEDAAQAQGATRHGRGIGGFGALAATSFYPGKNLGAFGDAGAVLTNDEALAGKVRALRNWGSTKKYHHPVAGFNSRLDSLQAVVLSAKLARLNAWNDLRRESAAYYQILLSGRGDVKLPATADGNTHVFHIFAIEIDNRDEVLGSMVDSGIQAGVHYPIPLHLLGATQTLGYGRGDFPNAESASERMISLPLFPGITKDQQERVVEALVAGL